ncbi:hydrophobic protein [Kitasatospora sp. NPDC059648]|uniref:hydrophobic protein n=1 Tax=Kitasatospora sp. NPDC059648 TaxID=3346894 RepID=UPI0036D067B3
MVLIILVLLLAIILGGVGFLVHALWWIALAVLVIWLLGFAFAGGRRGGGGRWYRW